MAGAIRQQAYTWTNVDPDLCHHMVSLGHNELTVLDHWTKCRTLPQWLLGDNAWWVIFRFISSIAGEVFLVKLPLMSVAGLYWWYVNIGSSNGSVPSGNTPPQPMLTHNELSQKVSIICPWTGMASEILVQVTHFLPDAPEPMLTYLQWMVLLGTNIHEIAMNIPEYGSERHKWKLSGCNIKFWDPLASNEILPYFQQDSIPKIFLIGSSLMPHTDCILKIAGFCWPNFVTGHFDFWPHVYERHTYKIHINRNRYCPEVRKCSGLSEAYSGHVLKFG